MLALISAELQNVQSSLLKEIFGSDSVVVKREGRILAFLLLLFRRFEMLATVLQHLLERLCELPDLWKQ